MMNLIKDVIKRYKTRKRTKKNEAYFHNYEKNRIKTQETINELNGLNNELNREKQEILKELDNKGISIDRLNTLNNKHEQRIEN